jgi:hypothetical protein
VNPNLELIDDASLNGLREGTDLDLSRCSKLQTTYASWQLASFAKLVLPPHFRNRPLPSDRYLSGARCIKIGEWKATTTRVRGFGEPEHGQMANGAPYVDRGWPTGFTPGKQLMSEAASYRGVALVPLSP